MKKGNSTMKRGDSYKHYKGGKYTFLSIAIPLQDDFITKTHLVKFFEARYHENTHDVALYTSSDGALFIDSDVPHVIYESKKDKKVWAREVDDFFGYKSIEAGNLIKRFILEKS